ncbi:hypothetical protein DOY81_010364, partial [Sarcophaga bullata]
LTLTTIGETRHGK